MKIGFVVDDGLDKPDGVQQYILSLGAEFIAMGHEVVYLAGETNNAPKGIMVYSMSKNIKTTFNGNKLTIPLPASSKNISKILNAENFDVLHVQIPHSPFMGAKVVNRAQARAGIVGTFHVLPYGFAGRVGTRLLGFALRRNLKKFNKFISVSQPAKEFAARGFKIESQVIPNMVSIRLFKGNGPADNKNVRMLFVGRLVERKGCLQLLKALSILKNSDELPDGFVLDVCGDGPLRRELEKYSASNDLAQNVRFHGFISQQEKINFMRNADISVFPSLSGESFGIVLLEAMAAGGGIVLGGDNPGYKSVMDGVPGSILNAKEPDRLASQLNGLFASPDERSKLYEAQQKHVRQFDSSAIARQVLAVYQTCIKEINS